MNPSQRILSLSTYIRANGATSEEICELLDVISDEFKASEQRQDKDLAKTKKNLNNIAKYLQTQGL